MKSLQFRTPVPPTLSEWKIDHQTQVLTFGSCFADVLGSQLERHKFPVLPNPFGTVFNPYSMAKLLTMVLEDTPPEEDLFVQNADGIWLHYDFHSSFWGRTRIELEEKIGVVLAEVKAFLETTTVLVVTFGTAYVYRYKRNLALVTNCHKMPPSEFVKELLSYEQLVNLWGNVIRLLKLSKRVILTVSPVRHTRETLPLNQVSKSTLRIFCHRLSEKYPNVTYFPAYEIMMDDLRDYRFYRDDLIHPNATAEEYIWQYFMETYFHPSSTELVAEWDRILALLAHRPRYGATASRQAQLTTTLHRLESLAEKLPVALEIDQVKKQLADIKPDR